MIFEVVQFAVFLDRAQHERIHASHACFCVTSRRQPGVVGLVRGHVAAEVQDRHRSKPSGSGKGVQNAPG